MNIQKEALFIDKATGEVYQMRGMNFETGKYKFYPTVKPIELNHAEMLERFNVVKRKSWTSNKTESK